MKKWSGLIFLFLYSLSIIACAPKPVSAPTPSTPTRTAAVAARIPDLEQGQLTWSEARCSACHGPAALGGVGPQLASTSLSYEQFLHRVRTSCLPQVAYTETQLPDQAVYNIYAWVRTQIPPAQWAPVSTAPTPARPSEVTTGRAMTVWTNRQCDRCHGVFAQGSPAGPTLAGLNDPVEAELARMRRANTIPEHSSAYISDEVFTRLYEWIKVGCVKDECYQ